MQKHRYWQAFTVNQELNQFSFSKMTYVIHTVLSYFRSYVHRIVIWAENIGCQSAFPIASEIQSLYLSIPESEACFYLIKLLG